MQICITIATFQYLITAQMQFTVYRTNVDGNGFIYQLTWLQHADKQHDMKYQNGQHRGCRGCYCLWKSLRRGKGAIAYVVYAQKLKTIQIRLTSIFLGLKMVWRDSRMWQKRLDGDRKGEKVGFSDALYAYIKPRSGRHPIIFIGYNRMSPATGLYRVIL